MTSALHLIAKHKTGAHITPADTCATITSGEELAAYRDGLKQRGALTTEAFAAIEAQRKRLGVR